MADSFHRFDGEWVSAAEWVQMPERSARIRLALGEDPVEDFSHRLPRLSLPERASLKPPAPNPDGAFVVELAGSAPLARVALLYALENERLCESLAGASFWGKTWDSWQRIDPETGGPCAEYQSIALAWPLATVHGDGLGEVAEALGRRLSGAGALGQVFGVRPLAWDKPADAASRALRLRSLGTALTKHIEVTLRSASAPFSSRRVWRELVGLGLFWGNLDLFHAFDSAGETPLFSVSAIGVRSDFSPERAAEGETLDGLALGFEVASSAAPLAVFESIVLALAFLRERLGGTPSIGNQRLDADRLDRVRDDLEATCAMLTAAGIAPGSPDALALL